MTEDQPTTIDSDDDPEDERDDGQINWEADGLENDDQLNISEELSNLSIGDEEDTEFHSFVGYKWESGVLILEVKLQLGKLFEAPFGLIKKDRPVELARFIRENVVESKRGGWYEKWSKSVLKNANRTLRRMHRMYRTDRISRMVNMLNVKELNMRRISRNKRVTKQKKRTKYGISVPNSVKEALELDIINKNTLWGDAMVKEMMALEKAKVFTYFPPNHKMGAEYQFCPLRMIFDVKQEDLRRKARMVAGGHVINATMYESYASVVQIRTIRLLETIAMNEDLKFMTGDIGNAFVQAFTNEKVYSIAGQEFGKKKGCTIVIKKALYGLSTSARQWNLTLGDSIRGMGFSPTRSDPDLWMKMANDGDHYEYIATYVDDLIIISKNPEKYMDTIKKIYPVRNEEESPTYYLGNNLQVRENRTIKVSSEKYILEILRKHEATHGQLRKEKVPSVPNDHPEEDDSPYLNSDGITEFQSIIGVCQWIQIAGRFDITFAVSSLSRFASNPREGHLNRAYKIFGYLKKYPKRGYVINPQEPILNMKYEDLVPDFGNQYKDFVEEEDKKVPESKMKELPITIFVDANHGHDKRTGKSISGIIVFVGRTPIYWCSKRQGSVQTSTFGAEFVALKKAVEEAITMRYYLRSMGVKVSQPTVIYGDNLSAITNVVNPGSQLKKKYLALAYHFCRENFSAGIVKLRKIDTKDNYADPFTKALVAYEFHGHMMEMMED